MVRAFLILVFFSLAGIPAMASEEKKPDTGLMSYIEVPPFVVTMYRRGRPKGNMTVLARLKLDDDEKFTMAKKYLPRLNSGYVIETSRLSHDYFDVERPVSAVVLGNALQVVTNRILGHNDARLLISNIIVQKK